jgi:hypothetical protein
MRCEEKRGKSKVESGKQKTESRKLNTKRFAMIVAALSVALVIGRHFEASWAGGEGYRKKIPVVTVLHEKTIDVTCAGVDATRENIVTCSGERKKVTFGASTIWMDENTQLVVAQNREGSEALTLYTGRIMVQGPTVLHVRDLEFHVTDRASLVNYGWLSKIDVYAISGEVTEASTVLASGTAQRFDTLAPYDDAEEINATFANAGTAPFYAWVEGN